MTSPPGACRPRPGVSWPRMSEDPNRLLETRFVSRWARVGIVSWSAIGVVVLLYVVFRYLVYPVRAIFPPLVLALVLVYVLNPIVSWLQARRVPRILGALLVYLVLLGALSVGLRFLIPVLVDQVEGFTRSLPNLLRNAQQAFTDVLERFGVEGSRAASALEPQQVLDVAGRLFSLTAGLLGAAVTVILGLILGIYLLVDLPKIQRGMVSMIPARRRPGVLTVAKKLGRAVGGFFRGQLLVALFVGLASMLALYIVGLPYWALVGMITGLFNLIPLIGPFIGGAIAAFVAFTTTTTGEGLLQLDPGWQLAVGSAIALTIVQQLDNHIVSPNVVARTVKLHPVTVMLALLAGGTVLGLWGMLLAVPLVAGVKILILHAWDTQMTWPPPASGDREQEERPEAVPPPPVAEPSSPGAPPPSRFRSWMDRWRGSRPAGRPSEPIEPRP